MKVKIQQFLRQNHSWSIVGWNIAKSLINKGYEVHLIPTDLQYGSHMPQDLNKYVKLVADKEYDMQISYTAMINFPNYLSNGNKNRFGIWNYEYLNTRPGSMLPGYAKYYKYTDKFLPSSNFSKEVFKSIGVPEDIMQVIPHGIDLEAFKNKNKYHVGTDKKYKILLNIAQPHKRKAIHLALDAFGRAFNRTDDVALIAKVSIDNVKNNASFCVDFKDLLRDFNRKYPNAAEVKVITTFIPDIVELYNACDINFSATYAECWHLPSLEALAAGLINIVPRYGGQLDFCNDDNCILIDGKIARAPRTHQYWVSSSYAAHFVIDVDDAAEKLNQAVKNYNDLKNKFSKNMIDIAEKYTWDNAVDKILELVK